MRKILMMNNFRKCLLTIALTMCLSAPLCAAPEYERRDCINALERELSGKKPQTPKGCSITGKLVMWLSLQKGDGEHSFSEILQFIQENPRWPNQHILRTRAEQAIAPSTSSKDLIVWFKQHPPQTTGGAMSYVWALKVSGQDQAAKAYAKKTWVERDFSQSQQKEFLHHFHSYLSRTDHVNRLDRLLWDNEKEQAQRMLSRVGNDTRRLAEARLAFKAKKKSGFPRKFNTHEGALYDQVHSLRRQKRFDEGAKLIYKSKMSPRNGKQWWREMHYIAREFIEQKRWKEAYRLVSEHSLSKGGDFATAEWTAGWLSLRFLNKPQQAIKHFKHLYDNVKSPISVGRACYWLGRAYEEMGKKQKAAHWYQKAAEHLTTYYGQLGAAKLRLTTHPELKNAPGQAPAPRTELSIAFTMLSKLGEKGYRWTRPIAIQMGLNAKDKNQKLALLHLIAKHAPHEVVWYARTAGSRKPLHVKQEYPYLPKLPTGKDLPEKALPHAIAYRESRFDPYAESYAGALGLMQFIPATAKAMAKRIGVKYSKSMLTSDPKYNVNLGAHHLAELLEEFDGSYILAIAAYNAGEGPVRRWLDVFGDPRKGEIDVIDWVELIPYGQTRNYVQRVLENLSAYRIVFEGKAEKSIVDDLQR